MRFDFFFFFFLGSNKSVLEPDNIPLKTKSFPIYLHHHHHLRKRESACKRVSFVFLCSLIPQECRLSLRGDMREREREREREIREGGGGVRILIMMVVFMDENDMLWCVWECYKKSEKEHKANVKKDKRLVQSLPYQLASHFQK